MRFKDKVAIVTGSGQGIGQSIATALAAEGASLIINDINLNAAHKTAEEIAEGVEIPGERDVGIEVARNILVQREKLGRFTSLKQVADVPQVGPERFAEIVETLGTIEFKIEPERLHFKKLIIENPNYFSTISDESIVAAFPSVIEMKYNTKYEELVCVGLYPEDDLLEAIIEVKLPYGYKGSLCQEGSTEYVSFFIDYDDGAGFVSVGAPAEVNVHDLLYVNGGHLFYAVRKAFIPKELLKCETPQIVKVRAILSWEKISTGPGYIPIWGNVLEEYVQIRPKRKGPIIKPVSVLELQAADKLVVIGDKKEIKEFIDKSIEVEEKIKKGDKVEEERLDFKKLVAKNPNYFGSISKSSDKNTILKAAYKLPPKTLEDLLPKLAVDPSLLIPVNPVNQKIKYEELRCVGLHPEDDLLEAVIEVKLPYGFNGDLCTFGSREYVAFYIDWGAGYQHVATSSVGVHDIPEVSDKHLFYAVKAKIPDIEQKLMDCNHENIVNVKAILSWNVDPTPYGHMYSPTWGNVLIRDIQIRPKDGASAQCDIEIINEVHVDDIIQSGVYQGLAIKIDSSNNTVVGTYDRPFGGVIACWGNINVPNTAYYRFRYSEDNGVTWKNITDKRTARNIFGFNITRSPDGNGWFDKNEHDIDVGNYSLTALMHWRSHGKNGEYLLRLELADATKTQLPGQTDDVYIELDNTGPELLEFGGTPAPLPARGVVVKDSAGNYRKCGTFNGEEEIKIYGNFKDDYFMLYRLKVFGGNINVSGVQIGSGRYDSGIPGIGDTGIIGASPGGFGSEIGTLNLCTVPQSPGKVKCAYGIELAVCDRTIVGYVRGYEFDTTRHWRDAFVTFDWDPIHPDPTKSCP